jgi:hypothetical protein
MRSVALIPKCAECEGVWLPADEEPWLAYLTEAESEVLPEQGRMAWNPSPTRQPPSIGRCG